MLISENKGMQKLGHQAVLYAHFREQRHAEARSSGSALCSFQRTKACRSLVIRQCFMLISENKDMQKLGHQAVLYAHFREQRHVEARSSGSALCSFQRTKACRS